MHPNLALLFAAFAAFVPVNSAPTALFGRQSSDDFVKQNGLDAQKLNAQFATMKETDACQDGQNACIDAAFAQCVSGKWTLTKCSGNLSCLALPLVNKAGTSIVCDNEADAAARIAASGATGGITGDGSNAPSPASSVISASASAAIPSSTSDPQSSVGDGDGDDGDDEDCDDDGVDDNANPLSAGDEDSDCEDDGNTLLAATPIADSQSSNEQSAPSGTFKYRRQAFVLVPPTASQSDASLNSAPIPSTSTTDSASIPTSTPIVTASSVSVPAFATAAAVSSPSLSTSAVLNSISQSSIGQPTISQPTISQPPLAGGAQATTVTVVVTSTVFVQVTNGAVSAALPTSISSDVSFPGAVTSSGVSTVPTTISSTRLLTSPSPGISQSANSVSLSTPIVPGSTSIPLSGFSASTATPSVTPSSTSRFTFFPSLATATPSAPNGSPNLFEER